MVKICNQLGDIKTGTQGEAVYQRYYGQQIRRVRRTKSGDISKPQKARRSLFKHALAWRAGLTLDEKRYIEGLAYARHYRDSEGIILSWDKLALKIALEVPTVQVIV